MRLANNGARGLRALARQLVFFGASVVLAVEGFFFAGVVFSAVAGFFAGAGLLSRTLPQGSAAFCDGMPPIAERYSFSLTGSTGFSFAGSPLGMPIGGIGARAGPASAAAIAKASKLRM